VQRAASARRGWAPCEALPAMALRSAAAPPWAASLLPAVVLPVHESQQ